MNNLSLIRVITQEADKTHGSVFAGFPLCYNKPQAVLAKANKNPAGSDNPAGSKGGGNQKNYGA
jgi:hypothetical protein